MTPEALAHAFADAINKQSVDELAKLMSDDHVFIDSLGTWIAGKAEVSSAWKKYFQMVPDYTLTIEETFVQGPIVLMLGTAQGTFAPDGHVAPENHWTTPAVWRSVVRGPAVTEWRVYADNEPIRKIIAKSRAAPALAIAEPHMEPPERPQ